MTAASHASIRRELAAILAQADGYELPLNHQGIRETYEWRAAGLIEDWQRASDKNPGRAPQGAIEGLCEQAAVITREERRKRQEAAEERQRLIAATRPPEPETFTIRVKDQRTNRNFDLVLPREYVRPL
jgi:hypothetical protein